MARYRAIVREMVAVEYEVEVEAVNRNASFRLAEDPEEWQNDTRPDIESAGGDVETLEYIVLESEEVEEA